ncbi:MAG TPA: universal stress protein [Gemmatimonadales bacterium]|nr:universal stress protein [Gemmatimonadales bacterium]
MPNRIMVPLDGSAFAETALPIAYDLARQHDAGVHLVRVHQPPIPVARSGGVAAYDPAFDLDLEREGRWYLDVLLGRIEAHERARSATAHPHGRVLQSLTEYIQHQGIDLVVMTTHARGGVSRMWLGSVADGLIRHAAVPVLLLRPGRQASPTSGPGPMFRRVLIPVDGGPMEKDMVEHAIALAGMSGVEYMLLRVVTEGALSVGPALPHRGADAGSRTQRATVQTTLDLQAESLRARGVTVRPQVIVNDDPAEGILRYAAEHDVDLIAMATRSRGGLERLLLGSVADRVLRQAGIPLLLRNPGQLPVGMHAEGPVLLLGTPAPAAL